MTLASVPAPLAIDIAAEAASPLIRNLDMSMFTADDLVNIILQRSEVLYDVPRSGRVIRAWNAGDDGPIRAEVDRLGDEIARRAAGVIHAEYRSLAPVLMADPPSRVADIGCGYALFDLFLALNSKASVLLIDIETNDRRHFGFAEEGAAYSNLSVARRLLLANGIAEDRIETLNPVSQDIGASQDVDLAVSFLSCGFHYPVTSYASYFRDKVLPGGAILLDLRAATAGEQLKTLAPLGSIDDQPAPPKARRILLRKPGVTATRPKAAPRAKP
ncbi:MAG: class I SAM-dependent methyltransferase [Rhodobacteraceae bacterium]|nr:class I SAM-dependent methyltransferase [Paracoccaceae bacterium]